MSQPVRPIDADNHYYESLDAFTRHLDPAFKDRGVRVLRDGKRVEVLIGGKVNRFIPNPTFDPIIVPGCIDLMFRGQIPDGVDPRTLMQVEPLSAAYQDRDARLAVMDEQGLDAVVLFPTLGCGVEQALRYDVDATMASLTAFNRWLEDDWGFYYEDRIIAAPMLSLADPDAAVAEVERVVGLGARVLSVRPAPVPTGGPEGRSFGHPDHDPVWARLAETGVPVAFHLADSGYHASLAAAWGGPDEFAPFLNPSPLQHAAGLRPGHPRHHRQPHRRRRVHPPPHAPGREHRERLRLGPQPAEAHEEGEEPAPVGVLRGPGRHPPPPPLGHPVLRGGPVDAGRPPRRRAHPLRLRLAPRRRPRRPGRLRRRARRRPRLRPALDRPDHARQRRRAARPARSTPPPERP